MFGHFYIFEIGRVKMNLTNELKTHMKKLKIYYTYWWDENRQLHIAKYPTYISYTQNT